MSRNYLALIKEALPAEAALRFAEVVEALGFGPSDPELALCAALASFVVSLGEFKGWAGDQSAELQGLLVRFLTDVDFRIAEAFTKCVDEMQTDVRTLVREIATSEFSAGAVLRSAAITAEVHALRNAIVDLEKAKAALEAAQITRSVREAPSSTFITRPRLFVFVAICLVLGVFLGSYWTKHSYAGWRPPAHAGAPARY